MLMLVSLQQASDHLRRDTTDDDADLEFKIQGASAAVVNYLKSDADFLDSDGDVAYETDGTPIGVPELVQIATLILVGHFYAFREGDFSPFNSQNYGALNLPLAVRSLLVLAGRKPTLV